MGLIDVFSCCKEWTKGIKEINGFIGLGFAHGMHYTVRPFKYCPWCGKELSVASQDEAREEVDAEKK